MSRNYDNWERLVAAVLCRERDWKICHEQSVTTSFRSSISSDFPSFSELSFDFGNGKDELFLKSAQPLRFQTVAGIIDTRVTSLESRKKVGKLIHVKDSPFAFTLQEWLLAPSFALGLELGTFTNTYAASLNDGTMVVVKRFRITKANREALEQRLKTIQCMEHENVVRLWGYIFYEKEIFGFYDYFHQRNVHKILHGQKGEKGWVQLDWEGRMRVAIGAAKGLLHIHQQSGSTFVHGSVKTSNIFINSEEYGCVDINPEIALSHYSKDRLYYPPEVYIRKKFSQASDVYCFGVVLIELLSGRSPWHFHYNEKHGALVDWALRSAGDEWTTMVFDTELLKYSLAKQAMSDMLRVALSCVKTKPEERPDMKHVVDMLQLMPITFPGVHSH